MSELLRSDRPPRPFDAIDPEASLPTRAIRVRPHPAGRAAPLSLTLPAGPGGAVVPGYRIHGRLGRGANGVVYRAVHLALDRPVALKMLGGSAGDPDEETLLRFRKEAQALASLRHPNIVPVFEVGEADGRPFFTMELVEGGDLAAYIRNRPAAPREAATIAVQLAAAVQAAHEAGILHRDLKPNNVLIAEVPGPPAGGPPPAGSVVPKIADFGLAKRFGQARGHDRSVTQAGDILGTPSYMAPEQAEGHGSGSIGPAADVYAVGAILYEMLAGRPPFEGGDAMRTVLMVLHDEPTPPARVAAGVPRDLETICLKCLEKDPRRRYPSARALADDLGRFLAGRPILARPVSAPERLWKWARRRPALAGLLGTTVVAVLAGLAGTTTMWMRANERAARETQQRELADRRGREVEAKAVEIETRLAVSYLEQGIAGCKEGEVGPGLVLMSEALTRIDALRRRAAAPADLERLAHLDWVARVNLARWAPQVPLRRRATLANPRFAGYAWVLDVDLSPDGRRALTGSRDGYLRLFDTETGAEVGAPIRPGGAVTQVSFSPDGKRFLTVVDDDRDQHEPGRVRVWDAEGRMPVGPAVTLGGFDVRIPAFPSPVTLRHAGFLTADRLAVQTDRGTVRVLRAGTDDDAVRPIRCDSPFTQVVGADAGRTLLTGHADGTVRRWDVETGRELGRTAALPDFVGALGLSPDGTRLLSGTWRGLVRQWDPATLKQLGPDIDCPPGPPAGPDRFACLFAADFSPDGRAIAVGGGLWSKREPRRAGFLRLLDAETGRPVHEYPADDPVWSVAFGMGGATLLAAREDSKLLVYSTQDGAALHSYTQSGNPSKVTVGRDGRLVLAADRGSEAAPLLADLGPARLLGPEIRLDGDCGGLAFTPDGRGLRVLGRDGVLRSFDVATGRPTGAPIPLPAAPSFMHAAADNRTAALWTYRRDPGGAEVFRHDLWDLERHARLGTVPAARHTQAVFDPAGRSVVMVEGDSDVLAVFEVDGRERWRRGVGIERVLHHPHAVAVSPDGRTVVAGPRQGRRLAFLDADTGRPAGEPWDLPGRLDHLIASPDGASVILAFADGYVRSFDLATRKPNGAAIPWKGRTAQVRPGPDGRTLAVRTEEATSVRYTHHDPRTGLTLGPPVVAGLTVGPVVFDPAGTALAVADGRTVRCWAAPGPVVGPADQVRCWVEAIARREFVAEPVETLTHLDDRAVGARHRRLREAWGGEPVAAPGGRKD